MQYTPLEDIPKIRETLRNGFRAGKTKSVAHRKQQLKQLGYLIQENMQAFLDTLQSDLGRPYFESDVLEITPAIACIKDAHDNVDKWAKTEKARYRFSTSAMQPQYRKEAKGTVLCISPYNVPVLLSMQPVVAALSAGNTVCLKPSEQTPATSSLLGELINKHMDPEVIQVVQGSVEVATKLLELQWDHITYTGSQRVARIVAAAAARYLTPTTLELGGKSPVIIDPKSDLRLAARRIWWGNVVNGGQVCVAPDYVLCPREVQDKLIKEINIAHAEFFPKGPKNSDSFCRMVSTNHTERIARMLKATKGDIVLGGEIEVKERYVAPTLVINPSLDEPLMQEEIFGPVLPIVPVQNVDEAIAFINARDHPLAIHVFSQNSKVKAKVADETQSGGFLANELLFQVTTHGLPFGGVGPSGSGKLCGKFGFDTLSHLRCTLDSPKYLDTLVLWKRYAPYTEANRKSLVSAAGDYFPDRHASKYGRGLWGLLAAIAAAAGISLA
ncbi:hypothetical protein EIP91_007991 [Steccherinum ochraceum]|uniref:Aldehyde dehydrogenase n=1 Tax=Steccherinum ochraceum TaxID=92696 RepID=A0A4R0R3L7_9APHY|nr:hypothetical protein EIP91_007991 [Steccherinum ochraceum]